MVCKTPAVLDVVPVEKRSDISIKEISKTDPGMVERALGVNWCIESDKFGFRIQLQDTPLTRRGILSSISSVYDPLGIVGPFLLKGRKILQAITALNDGWDRAVPRDLATAHAE